MPEFTMVDAVGAALAHEMARDPRVVVLGEDVGAVGGVFRATDGLLERFGPDRVIDTPLAEGLIAGMAIGMAAEGLRPVAEIQFTGFLMPALDQLANHASRLRNRTRGRLTCPMVLRSPCSGGIGALEHHSESPEAMLAHVPGLSVVVPSTPADAYRLLLAAIRDPDPVVVLEPTVLYRATREEFDDDGVDAPLGRAVLRRMGDRLTLVGWGSVMPALIASADELALEGVLADVLDMRSVAPLDREALLESVGRTGRCVIVHEAPLTAGFGAEIAAILADRGVWSLLAPIRRVCGYDTVMPLARLERSYIPDAERVLHASREVLSYS
ncbi:MAG: alpha-ketoacid dehydrogenase subunit beta [Actinobacteria bacterium]|nr:alpha-ketoacid dehydrogenase subunit beta [Thermoleophilia bacterium]MCB9010766.1 alpha-ketoacid dehydrogenase subunit beta [Actinomycetota bacterium]